MARHFAFLLAFVLASRVTSWNVTTFNADEWAFATAAREVLRGHLPYVTFFDIKPVGSSLLLAITFALTGVSAVSLHGFGTLCVLFSAFLIYAIVRVWTERALDALVAGLFYAAFSVLFSGLATMTEIMLAPFSCAGVLLLSRYARAGGRAGLLTLCGAGLAFGCAAAIKILPILSGTVLGIAIVATMGWRHGTSIRSLTHAAAYCTAMIAPTAAAAATYALAGHWQEFAYANYGFMKVYVRSDPALATIVHIGMLALEAWPLTLLVAIGLAGDAVRFARGGTVPSLVFIAYAWMACEIAAAVSTLRAFDHYFLMVLPPSSILAARSLAEAARRMAPASVQSGQQLAAGALALALVPVLPAIRNGAVAWLKFPDTQREVAKLVRAHQDPSDLTMVTLSYDLLPDIAITGAAIPHRVAIPVHLFGEQAALSGTDSAGVIRAVFATRPRLVLVDWVDLDHSATPAERATVHSALASGYTDIGARVEDWSITGGGTYHRADIHLFERNASPVAADYGLSASP